MKGACSNRMGYSLIEEVCEGRMHKFILKKIKAEATIVGVKSSLW